jgi:hypothetical protein
MMTEPRPALSPVQALGVALSTGPMHAQTMEEAQAAAVPMLDHLAAMSYVVVPEGRWEWGDVWQMREAEVERAVAAEPKLTAERLARVLHTEHIGCSGFDEEVDGLHDDDAAAILAALDDAP